MASYWLRQGRSVDQTRNNWRVSAISWLGNCTNRSVIATWERVQRLPDPPKFPELDGELPEPIPRSLHFLGGGDLLLATYMDHGVM